MSCATQTFNYGPVTEISHVRPIECSNNVQDSITLSISSQITTDDGLNTVGNSGEKLDYYRFTIDGGYNLKAISIMGTFSYFNGFYKEPRTTIEVESPDLEFMNRQTVANPFFGGRSFEGIIYGIDLGLLRNRSTNYPSMRFTYRAMRERGAYANLRNQVEPIQNIVVRRPGFIFLGPEVVINMTIDDRVTTHTVGLFFDHFAQLNSTTSLRILIGYSRVIETRSTDFQYVSFSSHYSLRWNRLALGADLLWGTTSAAGLSASFAIF